jgi:hypothetical protein
MWSPFGKFDKYFKNNLMDAGMKQNNFFKRTGRLFVRAKEVSKEKGMYYVVRVGIFNRPMNLFSYWHH